MPDQLKIVIDADVQKAVAGIQSVTKVITGDFTKATNAAALAATNLSSEVAASVQKINTSLAGLKVTSIDVDVNTTPLDASIKRIQSKFSQLVDPEINLLADTTKAEAKIKDLLAELATIRGSEIFIRANDTQALKVINEVENELKGILDKQIKLNVDTSNVADSIQRIKTSLGTLKVTPLDVTVDTTSIDSSIRKIQAKFASIVDPKINFLADTVQSEAKIKDLLAELSSLKGSELFIRVNDTQALKTINEVENELKGILDKQVRISVNSTSLKEASRVISGDFVKATQTAAAGAFDLERSVKQATDRINASIDKMVDDALGGASQLKSSFGDFGAVTLDSTQVQAAIEKLRTNIASLQARIPVTVTSEGLEKLNSDIAKTKAELSSLVSKNIRVDVDASAALQKVGSLKTQLSTLSNVPFRFNTGPAIKSISDLQVKVSQLDQSLKTTAGLNAFQSALGKSTTAVRNLQATGAGLNSFYSNLVSQNSKAVASLGRLPISSNQASQALINLGRVAQDAPFGFIGIANNLNPLLESFQRLKATAGTTGGALKAMASSLLGPAGIGIAVSVVSSLLVVFGDRLFGAGKKAEDAEDKIKTLNDSLKEIQGQAAKEASGTAGLIAVLKSETETRERKIAALKELKTIQPEIFGQLKLEGDAVKGLDAAYQQYIANLRLVITAKLKQAQLEGTIQEILKREGLTLTKSQKDGLDFIKRTIAGLNEQRDKSIRTGDATAGVLLIQKKRTEEQQKEATELNNLYKDQAQLIKDLTELSKGIKINIDTKGGKADFDKFINDVIARAKQFSKEFGNAFVIPDLEESFFVDKEEIFKRATKLLDDFSKDKLQIKLPVLTEFELLPEPPALSQSTIDNFFTDLKLQVGVPIDIVLDPTLSKDNLAKIDQKLDLRKKFSIFGDLGLQEFNKIDFSNINAGLAEATKRLQGMMEIATTLNQAIGQGLSNAFNAVFDAVLEGKNVFKALGQAVKELIVTTIKAVAQMLILRLITNAIFPGGGGAIPLPRLGIGGQANFGGLTGIGSRAFNNVLTVNVVGNISGDTIRLAGQRAADSSGRFG